MSRIPAAVGVVTAGALTMAALTCAPIGHADAVAYLINVTVRPGYNFANAEDALAYGNKICDAVTGGDTYAQVMSTVKTDFATTDEYQASYLITQAVNELCPAQIWQLRNSAAGYRPPVP